MSTHRIHKDHLYAQLARVTKALAAPARLAMLDLLAQGERTVESLAEELSLSPANASKHLMVLREAQLVAPRREGSYVFIRLTTVAVPQVIAGLRDLATSQLVELDRVVRDLFADRDRLAAVGRAELLAQLDAGTVTVLDVRPESEFRAGHLPGALSFPVETLKDRLADLPRGSDVIAYCRGPWCVYAYEAVALLRAHGYRARRLEDGFPEWRSAGLPVESSDAPLVVGGA